MISCAEVLYQLEGQNIYTKSKEIDIKDLILLHEIINLLLMNVNFFQNIKK